MGKGVKKICNDFTGHRATQDTPPLAGAHFVFFGSVCCLSLELVSSR